jgi:hypothetical protein
MKGENIAVFITLALWRLCRNALDPMDVILSDSEGSAFSDAGTQKQILRLRLIRMT